MNKKGLKSMNFAFILHRQKMEIFFKLNVFLTLTQKSFLLDCKANNKKLMVHLG